MRRQSSPPAAEGFAGGGRAVGSGFDVGGGFAVADGHHGDGGSGDGAMLTLPSQGCLRECSAPPFLAIFSSF